LKAIVTYIFLFGTLASLAQSPLKETKSPHTASILSAVLPGAGQFYNEKYWKIPIVYGAMGTALYFANDNNQNYQNFKNALESRNKGELDQYNEIYSNTQLLTIIDFYQRNRDISYILLAAAYILNIVDASVDAHLFDFDINEDLSVSTKPSVTSEFNKLQPVISFQINL
jgi:TM2 domain-containing membrane protein YozV